jgi:hypothetical protein
MMHSRIRYPKEHTEKDEAAAPARPVREAETPAHATKAAQVSNAA